MVCVTFTVQWANSFWECSVSSVTVLQVHWCRGGQGASACLYLADSWTLLCFILYHYYWVRVTPRHPSPRLTRWRKQCLESGSGKATRTRYQVGSSHGSTQPLGLRPSGHVDPWLEPRIWCNPDPKRGLYSLNLSRSPPIYLKVIISLKVYSTVLSWVSPAVTEIYAHSSCADMGLVILQGPKYQKKDERKEGRAWPSTPILEASRDLLEFSGPHVKGGLPLPDRGLSPSGWMWRLCISLPCCHTDCCSLATHHSNILLPS